jgi:hypothetical protein
MRIVSSGSSACGLLIIAASAMAGPPQAPARDDAHVAELLVPHVPASPDSDKEIAGLSRRSRPELLTWERIYALAIVRARTHRGAFAPTLDPGALATEAAQHDVADFARFRADFRAGATFRDPGAAVLELLSRLQSIDNARRNVAVHENLDTLLRERAPGESSGLNHIDVDMVRASLVRTRRKLDGEIRQFRDGLDELKFLLGLSPHAPVILDRQSLAWFQAVYDSVDLWAKHPQRNLQMLPRLINRLPALGEVVLDGQAILAKIEANSDPWEDVLSGAARLAIKSRSEWTRVSTLGNSDVQVELRVRRALRNLFETRRAYQGEKQNYELAIRLRDEAFERVLAPPLAVNPSRSLLLERLIDQVTLVRETQDRLASLWASFGAERLAFYHDVGELPHQNWKSFYADLLAGPGTADAAPSVPPTPTAGDAPQPQALPNPPRP